MFQRVHSVLDNWYTIKKSTLDAQQLSAIRRHLVLPIQFTEPQKFFTGYVENEKWIYVPRSYGLQTFGAPAQDNRRDGKFMDVEFCGTLDEQNRYQESAARTVLQHLQRRPFSTILSLPCGYGKTVTALYVASQLKRKTLIVVHTAYLLQQWVERTFEYLPSANVGVIRGDICEIDGNDIVIGTLQTLHRRRIPNLGEFGTIIMDEAHHAAARTFFQVLTRTKPRYLFALTATPRRNDGLTKVLTWLFGRIAFQVARKDQHVDIRMVKWYNRYRNLIANRSRFAYVKNLQKLQNDKRRTAYIVRQTVDYALESDERHILVLSKYVAHLRELQSALRTELERRQADRDITVGTISADIKNLEQRLHIAETNRIVLGTYNMAKEGLDVKTLNTLVLALPSSGVEQFTGRILRTTWSAVVPRILDVWDPYDVFDRMGWSRRRYYKKNRLYDVKISNEGDVDRAPVEDDMDMKATDDGARQIFASLLNR